jgi:hypothetical protein
VVVRDEVDDGLGGVVEVEDGRVGVEAGRVERVAVLQRTNNGRSVGPAVVAAAVWLGASWYVPAW